MDLSEAQRPVRPVAIYSPHPLVPAERRELLYAPFEDGETLAGYLRRTGIAGRLGRQPYVCTVNGARVPRALWRTVRPKPGTLVHVRATVRSSGGDGGGKNPVATVLLIALVIVAPYAAAALGFTAGTLAFAAASSAIVVAGGLAINRLFPPPRPQLPQKAGESPTYSLSGGSNRARPFEPMPVVMGTHRVFPDFGSKSYTEFQDDDQFLYQIFDLGYNDVALSDFRIGATPLSAYTGVMLEESGSDGKLYLFPGNVDSIAGATLDPGVWIQRTSSPNAGLLSVELVGLLYRSTDGGGLEPLAMAVKIDYRAVGDVAWTPVDFADDSAAAIYGGDWGRVYVATLRFNEVTSGAADEVTLLNGTRKPLRRTFQWGVPQGQYEIRVQRVTPDEGDERLVRELVWSQLRTYRPDPTDYTGRKRVALKIRASGQLSGQVEQLSCVARARTDVWNGSAWVASTETSNPAWWFLKAIRGTSAGGRRMWGGGVDDVLIDLDNLKDFGAWCDAQELSFNGVFDQPLSLLDMLSAISLAGRGTASWANGQLGVVWDAPDQPEVSVFGMSNIERGSFEIDYATDNLADEIVVSFINPELDWQQDTVRVTVPGVTSPVKTRTIQLFGCTNRAQAARAANLYAAANAYRNRRYRWRSDFEAMTVSRGDVLRLSHDLASYDYSGRFIEGGDASTLVLERAVPLYTGGSWIVIVKPDGSFGTYAVDGGAGESDTLTLASPLPFDPWADVDHPPYDYKWLYGATETPGRLVKIDAIRPLDETHVEVSAIDEDLNYYAAETNPYAYTPPRRIFNTGYTVANLSVSDEGVRAAQGYVVRLTVSWDAGSDFAYADVRMSTNGATYQSLARNVHVREVQVLVDDGVSVAFEVTGYSSLGVLGQNTVLTTEHDVDFAAAAPPSRVPSFALDGMTFRWGAVSDVDVVGYVIRYHYGENRSLDDATRLHEGLLPYSPKTFDVLPSGTVTFLIVAVDAAGLESATAAVVVKDIADPELANVVETIDFDADTYPGTLTGGALSGGDLLADSTVAMYNADEDAAMYGADSDPFYATDLFSQMQYQTDEFSFPANWIGSSLVVQHEIEGDAIKLEYSQGSQEPMYGPDGDPMYDADGDPMYAEDNDWRPWPGTIGFEGGIYALRVTTGQGPVQGAVRELAVLIDVPDVDEALEGVAIDAGGTRLVLTKTFDVIKNIQLTLEDDGGAAITARYLDKDAALGPLVKCFNASNVATSGHVDAHVRGR